MADIQMLTAEDCFKNIKSQLEQMNADPSVQDCFVAHAREPAALSQSPSCCQNFAERWT